MTTTTPPSAAGVPVDAPADAAGALLARLDALRERVAALVEHRSAADPTSEDPLRGLYLSEGAVRHLLRPRPAGDGAPEGAAPLPVGAPAGPGDRLARLGARAGLTELDTAALLIALAPDVDRTFEPLYGYLNDDVSRRRATVGLALDLCGMPAHRAAARNRFHASAPLPALGLLEVEETERPFLTRPLRVPDRLVGHLLGDDTPDAALAGLLLPMPGPPAPPADDTADAFVRHLAARLGEGPLTAYLREPREGDGLAVLARALDAAGIDALRCAAPCAERAPELLR
ncbi:ATP-binding protein, partial [Streptomyces sp. NPDC002454]